MSTDVVRALLEMEQAPEAHLGRLLVLLGEFTDEGSARVEGLTKLAKLDFLLRYPVLLERALAARNKSTRAVKLEEFERTSVESRMVRYRFGPWDHRYRQWLNILVARGLAVVSVEGRTVTVGLTDSGVTVARHLADSEAFADIARRAAAIRQHFDLSATYLVRFVYETFPELVSLRSNEAIGS